MPRMGHVDARQRCALSTVVEVKDQGRDLDCVDLLAAGAIEACRAPKRGLLFTVGGGVVFKPLNQILDVSRFTISGKDPSRLADLHLGN